MPNFGAIQSDSPLVDKTSWKWSFAKNVASGVDSDFATVKQTGSGMAVSQASGNLVVTTGTTAYSETVIRSNDAFSGTGVVRYMLQLSQRIANNNFAFEFVDVLGDSLSMTINSATSVTVTVPGTTLTTANDAGKGIWIGMCSVASCPTQRATIASVTGEVITLTVAGFPASGTGTCSLFGYNFYQIIYSGASPTVLGTGVNTQRLGWQNTAVSAIINTTATPGHIGILETSRHSDFSYIDQVPGTATSVQSSTRAFFNQNLPDVTTPLYLQVRAWNGSSAPATTTTLTMGFINAEVYDPLVVNVSGIQPFGFKNALPVTQQGTATVTASGTVTITNPAGTTYNLLSTASLNAAVIKASAGILYELSISNPTATVAYVKLYNKATAPTVGTDVPVQTITVPATSTTAVPLQLIYGQVGKRFATGIAIACTAGVAASDTANAVAGVQINGTYI